MSNYNTCVLLATLGSEPQVVTITLDLLLERRVSINHVVILHNDPAVEPTRSSLERLEEELQSFRYRELSYEGICFRGDDGKPLADITLPGHNRAVFQMMVRALRSLKETEQTVHFQAAGGRKAMAMYAMLSAQLMFDEGDRLWNLWSEPELLRERRMHANPREAELLPVPVLSWRLQMTTKRQFISSSLTPAEADIVEKVTRGLSDKEIATSRGSKPSTIGDQLSGGIFPKLRLFLRLPEEELVNRYTIMREFGPYFEIMDALGEAG